MADAVDARGITLDTYDFTASVGTVLSSNMAPDPAIAEYNQRYGRTNPLIERTRSQLQRGRVYRASDYVPVEAFVRTELYNTVYRKLGIKHVGAIGLDYRGDVSTQLSVIKPNDAGDFSDTELKRLTLLQVHARQAYAGYRALLQTQRRLDELTSLWNLIEFAVMIFNDRGELRFSNRAAEDLLRALPHQGSGNSAATALRDNRELAAALRAVFAAGGVQYTGVLGLATFPHLRATVFGLDGGSAAVLLTDPSKQRDLPLEAFIQRFGLTEAEARVCRALAAGDSLKEAAERIGIGYETARTQLKSAMAKNGWRRQATMLGEIYSELLPFGLDAGDAL